MKKHQTINKNIVIKGARITLRPLTVADAKPHYVDWLNDKEINQYLENRFSFHTVKTLKDYLKKRITEPNVIFLAIIRKDTSAHIGNIKLGPIDEHHKLGEIGIIIGDKNSWGQGFATEAIVLLSRHSFKTLKLHKLTAGAYAENIGSIKAFLKAGFFEEGKRKEHFYSNGHYTDAVLLAKIRP